MTFPALDEVQGKLELKRKELHTIFSEAGEEIDFTKVKSVKGTTREIAAHVRGLNDEMTDLSKELADLQGVESAVKTAFEPENKGGRETGDDRPDGGTPGTKDRKSLGEHFVKSAAFTDLKGSKNGPLATIDVELKTLMQTSDGFEPESTRTGRIVDFAVRPIQVTDIIPQTTTTMSSVKFMEETVFGTVGSPAGEGDAAETAEGDPYPESELEFTERTSIVRKISTFLPVTDEQLEDEPQVRGLVDNRLMFMVRQRLDRQVIVGDGVAPNLTGVLNVSGIQTQARGTDPVPDAIYKGLTLVRVTGRAQPNAVVLNPFDWQDIRLLRTSDGIYIWGNPSDAGPERIWGLGVVQADVLTQGTGLVGDWANFSELSVRRGVDVQVSNSHGEFFVQGKLAIRADMRAAFIVYRPAAFAEVTGL